jgi:hypothetical protein
VVLRASSISIPPAGQVNKPRRAGSASVSEQRFFYHANVDYTFCSPGGRPLFSVEFDGLGGGFSKVGVYIPHRPTRDRNRKWKLDTKLRFTAAVGYPLMIVSFEEVRSFDDESITILDGIIGQFLAKHKLHAYLSCLQIPELEEYAGPGEYDEWARGELIQDAVMGAEVVSTLENDPLARRAAQEHEAVPGTAVIARCGCMILRSRTLRRFLSSFKRLTPSTLQTSRRGLRHGNKR